MPEFTWTIHKNERLNLAEGLGRKMTSTAAALATAGVSVTVWTGPLATQNTSTDFDVDNVGIATGQQTGHDGYVHPPNQSVVFTIGPRSIATGGHYIVKARASVVGSTEVLVARTKMFVDSKGAT